MGYIAGNNMPGYLPMDDEAPFVHETFDEAKRELIDELERWADSASMVDNESGAENLSAAAEDVNLWSGPDSVIVETEPESTHHLGQVFWINEVDDDEIAHEQDEACEVQGCKRCTYCGRFDCGACRAGEVVDSGSTHKLGCSRDWIG